VDEIKTRLTSIRMTAPFQLTVRESGYFPSERSPRVIWLGVQSGQELAQLAARVEESLAGLGIAKEHRPFSAHLTLGRLRTPDRLLAVKELLSRRQPLELGSFTADEFSLYESQLSREGSVYRKIGRFPIVEGTS
jgi:2'-5' RNA ligase